MIASQGIVAFTLTVSLIVLAVLVAAYEIRHDYIEPEPDYWRPPPEEELDFIEALRATGGMPPWEETRKHDGESD